MPTPSAEFTVNGVAYTGIVTVTPGATVNLALASTFGVSTVQWSVVGNHGPSAVNPTITPAGSPSGITASFTFPVSPADQNYLIQCRINGGRDRLKRLVPGYFFRALVGSGALPLALGEKLERHPTYGWLLAVNTGISGELSLSAAAPANLSLTAAAAGSSEDASPSDHVHTFPNQAANTVLANVTGSSAAPTAAAPQDLWFVDATSGAGNLKTKPGPVAFVALAALADDANADYTLDLSTLGNGSYRIVCEVKAKHGTTRLTVAQQVCLNRVSGTATLEGAAADIDGGDPTGLTLTLSASGGDLVANVLNETGSTLASGGGLHFWATLRDLI